MTVSVSEQISLGLSSAALFVALLLLFWKFLFDNQQVKVSALEKSQALNDVFENNEKLKLASWLMKSGYFHFDIPRPSWAKFSDDSNTFKKSDSMITKYWEIRADSSRKSFSNSVFSDWPTLFIYIECFDELLKHIETRFTWYKEKGSYADFVKGFSYANDVVNMIHKDIDSAAKSLTPNGLNPHVVPYLRIYYERQSNSPTKFYYLKKIAHIEEVIKKEVDIELRRQEKIKSALPWGTDASPV